MKTCLLSFLLSLALIAHPARAASGFGVFTGGYISFTDRVVTIRRAGSSEKIEITITDRSRKIVDARWYGEKLLVQLMNQQGRTEQRVYSSRGSYSNR